jgi:pimeloyl-ACP methyl ester carboxylesterase
MSTPAQCSSSKAIAGSLLAGAASAFALVAGPFGSGEATITGAILSGFAIAWALLARSCRWAAVPAIVLGLTGAGLLLLTPSPQALDTLSWLWPPLLLVLVVWMAFRARSWLLYPVLAVMALTALGGGFETVASSSSGGADPVAGDRLVDVGGHRLNIRCIGSGTPTVVLEPGLGETASAMARRIAPEVSRTTRVCVYDRAGHGRSDVAPSADAARDLHVLLHRAHVPAPYVLAGHSLGGMFVLDYANRYPAEVGGVVLVDSMHPRETRAAAEMSSVLELVPIVARTGLARLLFDPEDGEPVAQARQFVRDVEQMPAQLRRAAQLDTLGTRPLGVVTAARGSQAGWTEAQNDLAALSSRAFHRTIAGSTHQSLIDDPEDAAASSRAIRDIVVAVRRPGGA